MARKRDIDPGIWVSEQFISLQEPWARLLYVGMISHADDEGRMKANPQFLKTIIFPGDNHEAQKILNWRNSIQQAGLIILYQIDGIEYLFHPNWHKYQYVSKPTKSKCPIPPKAPVREHSVTATVVVQEHSVTDKSAKKLAEVGEISASAELVDGKDKVKTDDGHKSHKQDKSHQLDLNSLKDTVGVTEPSATKTGDLSGTGTGTGTGTGIDNKEIIKEKLGSNFKYYEKHIGKITQTLSQKLIDAEEEYSPEWVTEALEIGSKKESCSWAYIETVLKNAKRIGISPKEINTKGNGHTPKELDEQINNILDKIEGILNLKFSYRNDEYKHVKHGIELGYTTEDFLGCTKMMKADKYWKDIAVIPIKSIVKQIPAFKAGKFKPQPPTESERRYKVSDYLPPEEEKPTKK